MAGTFMATSRGTTSACAENTSSKEYSVLPVRNYLRVRGEYTDAVELTEVMRELPPRARRILAEAAALVAFQGTTSACAENTAMLPLGSDTTWNYLRVRGEYL